MEGSKPQLSYNNVGSDSLTKSSPDKARSKSPEPSSGIPAMNRVASGSESGPQSGNRNECNAANQVCSSSPRILEIGGANSQVHSERHAEAANSPSADCSGLPITLWNEDAEDTELDLYAACVYPTLKTYPKNLLRLCFSFHAERRDDVINVLINLPKENVGKLTAFLENLTDYAYEDVASRLGLASLPRCQTYLEILASYCMPPMANVPYKCSVYSNDYDAYGDYPNAHGYQKSGLLQDGQWAGEVSNHDQPESNYLEYDSPADVEDTEDGLHDNVDINSIGIAEPSAAIGSKDGDNLNDTHLGKDNLVQKVHDLPPEIYDQVLESVLNVSFRPGELFPQQNPTCYGYHCVYGEHYPNPEPTVFLALPKALYPMFREDCWSGNTWVIGQGSPFYTVEFLNTIPESIHDMIRSVYMSLTSEDLFGFEGVYLHQRIRQEREDFSKGGEIDNLEVLERFEMECDSFATEVTQIWFDKFYPVSSLSLKRLTIDLRKAYAPDGTFLGLEQIKLFPPFCDGMPRLTILAPTKSLEDDIWEVFARNNPRRNY